MGESGAWVKGGPRFSVPHRDAEALEESSKATWGGRVGGVSPAGLGDGPLSSRNREMSELCKWNKA